MTSELAIRTVDGDDAFLRVALSSGRLPVDDLTEAGRRFYGFACNGQTIGFGGLEMYGECALLRSVVVMADYRGRGFGQAITRNLVDCAFDDGAGAVYLLTDTAAPFFEALGFRVIARALAPGAILGTRQAASLCPASATLMVRNHLS